MILLMILVLTNTALSQKQLTCDYSENSWTFWPRYKECSIFGESLTNDLKNETFSITGSETQKLETTGLYLFSCPKIEFIPNELISELPSISGLVITSSSFPIFPENLITKKLGNLKYLNLCCNDIETIEEHAFRYLPQLKWISLYGNKLESLNNAIFSHNSELEFIFLQNNEIKQMNPYLFNSLNALKYIDIERNKCVDKEFGCKSCKVSQSELNDALFTCFWNYNLEFPTTTQSLTTTEGLHISSAGSISDTQECYKHVEADVIALKDSISLVQREMREISGLINSLIHENIALKNDIKDLDHKIQSLENSTA